MADINLLPTDVRAFEQKTKQVKILKLVGVGSLLLAVVISGTLVGLFLITRQGRTVANKSVAGLETVLAGSQEKENSAKALVAKSSELLKVLRVTPRYSRLLSALSAKVPADVNIKELTVTSPTKVNVSGDAAGYLSLSQFLKVLTADSNDIFSGETLQSVVLDNQTGRVQFVMLVSIRENSLII